MANLTFQHFVKVKYKNKKYKFKLKFLMLIFKKDNVTFKPKIK